MNTGALVKDANGIGVQYPSAFSMLSGGDAVEVNSAQITSNVVVVYTEEHSYQVGQTVDLNLNPVPVEMTLADMAVSSNVATLHTTGNHSMSAGDTAEISCDIIRSISAISATGALVTFTTGATPHGFKTGDTVELFFSDGTENWESIFNGSHVITATPSATTFKIALATEAYALHDIPFGTARVSISESGVIATASTNVFTMPLTRANFSTFTFGATEADTVIFTPDDPYSGTRTITAVNSPNAGTADYSISFALTHANRSNQQWTGLAVGYFQSPVASGSGEIPLMFPENAFRLRVKPYTSHVELMVTSNALSGGYISIPHAEFFDIPGKPGDVVIISRDSGATPFDFIFDTLSE